MTEQDMTTAHIKQTLIDMRDAVERESWDHLVELASDVRTLATKQAMDAQSLQSARYGKR